MLRSATIGASTRRLAGVRRAVVAATVLATMTAITAVDRTEPARAEVAAGSRPNIVLVITDDQRARTLSLMPQLRRRLSGRGVRFSRAFVPNPSCCPSRVSFLTGTYSHTNGVWKNSGPYGGFEAFDDASTLATWLDDEGYRTGLFGKYLNGYRAPDVVPPGWDEWFAFIAGDGRTYYGFNASVNGDRVDFPDSEYSTVTTYERTAEFIRTTPAAQPLFAMWTPVAPHRPFVSEGRYAETSIELPPWRPPSYNERDVSDKSGWLRRTDRLDAAQRAAIDQDRIGQYRTLLSVDDGVAEIVKALRQTGRLSNTLIVFASDNGLMWGEHRLRHKAAPYDGATRVPMVVRYDDVIDPALAGTTMGSLVLNIDLAPTVAEITGVEPTAPVDGRSIVPVLDGSSRKVRTRFVLEHAKGGVPAFCGARSRRELFIRYTGGEEEYYRLDADPWALENAVDERAWRAEVAELRRFARRVCRPRPPGFSW